MLLELSHDILLLLFVFIFTFCWWQKGE